MLKRKWERGREKRDENVHFRCEFLTASSERSLARSKMLEPLISGELKRHQWGNHSWTNFFALFDSQSDEKLPNLFGRWGWWSVSDGDSDLKAGCWGRDNNKQQCTVSECRVSLPCHRERPEFPTTLSLYSRLLSRVMRTLNFGNCSLASYQRSSL